MSVKKYLTKFLSWWRTPQPPPPEPPPVVYQPELDEVVLYPVTLRASLTPKNYAQHATGFLSRLPALLTYPEASIAARDTAESVEHTVRNNLKPYHDTFTTQLYGNLNQRLALFNVQVCSKPTPVRQVTLLLPRDTLGELFHPFALTPNDTTMSIITAVAEAMGLSTEYIHRSGKDLCIAVYTPLITPYYLRDHHVMRQSYFHELQKERIDYE